MTERDPREELADVARGVRRWIERERAAGHAELILGARGAAPGGPAPPAAAPAASGAPAPPAAGSPPARAASAARAAPAPSPPSPPAEAWEPVASAAVAPPRVNLFGEVEAEPAPPPPPLDFDLPPVHPPLHPIGEAARRAIHEAAGPELEAVAAEARACRKCGLCDTRRQAVPGVGSAFSGIAFVGEAPGADEDAQGEPFVGRAGKLLTDMIRAMDERGLIPGVRLTRETVFIANVLKCRPPENRNPLPHEIESCSPYLRRQLEALRPRVICCLGKFAAELLVGVRGTLGSLRGRTYRFGGSKLIVTYHPAAMLRNPAWKRPVWEDLQRLAREYQTDAPGT